MFADFVRRIKAISNKMLIKQLIEENLKIYEKYNSFIAFYRAYYFAVMYKTYAMKSPVKKNKKRNKALRNYYWGSLKEVYGILKNPFFHIRFENESDYINSFKRNYYLESQIRQKSMLFLKQKVREDYKLILEVLSILSIDKTLKTSRINL